MQNLEIAPEHEIGMPEISQLAIIKLDSVYADYQERVEQWKASKGTSLESNFFEDARKAFEIYNATKAAYKSIGLWGSTGIHRL
jgi:hypothetical protein